MISSIKKNFLSPKLNLFFALFIVIVSFLLPRAFVSAAPPVVTLDVSSTFVSAGSDVTLTWTSTGADSCTASSGRYSATGPSGGFNGSIPVNGWAYSSFLYFDTWFRVDCTNSDGTSGDISSPVVVQLELNNPADPYVTGQPVTFYGSRGTGNYFWTANGGGVPGTQGGGTDFTVTWNSPVTAGCTQGQGSVLLGDSFDGQSVCHSITVQTPAFSLNVTKGGTGLGTVTSNPAGISCGVDCSEDYSSGTSVVLTAAANAGSIFAGWTGCTSTSGALPNQTCTVSMTSSKNVTATFNANVVLPNLAAALAGQLPVTASSSVSFTGTISNTSSAPTNAGFNNTFSVRNPAGVISTLSINAFSTPLAGNSSRNVTSSPYIFPSSGLYAIMLCADQPPLPNGVIVESNDNNNCTGWRDVQVNPAIVNGVCAPTHYNCTAGTSANGASGASWTWNCLGSNGGTNASCSEAQSDLTVAFDSVTPRTATRGQSQNYSATISNIGTASTLSNFSYFFQFSLADNGSQPIVDQSSYTTATSLAAGTSVSVPFSYTYSTAGVDYIYIRVCADKSSSGNLGTIDEVDENNNCGSWDKVQILSPATATANIRANNSDTPNPIPYNATADITWTSTNATSCTVTPPNWTELNASAGTHVLNLTDDITYTLSCLPGPAVDTVFVDVLPLTQNLNVIKTGQGTVTSTSNPAQATQVNCGAGCQAQGISFSPGAIVTLTATPGTGRIFTGWSGDCSGRGACNVTMDSGKTVYANFAVDPDYREF